MRAELIGKGLSENDAFKAVNFIEVEDILNEFFYSIELRDRERAIKHFAKYWIKYFEIDKNYQIDSREAVDFLYEQRMIEWEQRQLLARDGNRQPSVFLAAVLKYFCKFDDWQILAITGVIGLPSVGVESDKLGGLGLGF
jgi:hypothetical protein